MYDDDAISNAGIDTIERHYHGACIRPIRVDRLDEHQTSAFITIVLLSRNDVSNDSAKNHCGSPRIDAVNFYDSCRERGS